MSEAGDGERPLTWRVLWAEVAEAVASGIEARWIGQTASGRDATEWALGLDDPVTQRQVARVDAMVARRRAGEPLQYVLGSWPFRGVDLMVDRRVLIPRPETEEVAGVAIEAARARPRQVVLVDLGTGSGAIALAAADELPVTGVEIWATDVSEAALEVARANLAGVGRRAANVRMVAGRWFEALPAELRGRVDVLVANPPYVADGEDLPPEVAEWEPVGALRAGPDGLDDVREVVAGAPGWLAPGGTLVVEIGAAQGSAVLALAGGAGLVDAEVRQDAAGRDRMLVARRAG